jgi:hypothetical protein
MFLGVPVRSHRLRGAVVFWHGLSQMLRHSLFADSGIARGDDGSLLDIGADCGRQRIASPFLKACIAKDYANGFGQRG